MARLFGRWFKRSNRLEHEDPSERLQAVQDLSDDQAHESQQTLLALAARDADLAVREAAIKLITDPDALGPLLEDEPVAASAAQTIALLVAAGRPSQSAAHPHVLEARIHTATATTLNDLIAVVEQPEQAAELALRCPAHQRDQVLALTCLRNETGLATLEKLSRGRDKACNRHARQRLESLKATRAKLQTAQERLVELDASINKELNHHPHDSAALITHRQKLSRLQEMRTSAVGDVDAAAHRLGELSGLTINKTIPPNPLESVDLSIPDPANDPFRPLVDELAKLAIAMRTATDLAQITAVRDVLTESWLANADAQPPNQSQHRNFTDVSRQYQELRTAWERLDSCVLSPAPAAPAKNEARDSTSTMLERRVHWQKTTGREIAKLAWPKDHQKPAILELAIADEARVAQEIRQLREQQKALAGTLVQQVEHLKENINQGKINDAKDLLRNIRHLQKSGIPGEEHEINALAARLNELKDWQSFATHPKRDELLRAVTGLVDHPLAPPDQADRLKEIRLAWDQLGLPNGPEELREQSEFDALADKAFSTCRAYYDEQTQVREANLGGRKALCEHLQSYLEETDWATADMQAADTIMRQARQEWRTYHPCERRALEPVEQRFEALQAKLHAKVKSAWENNIAQKRAIVDQAKALLDHDDIQDAINSAKALQNAWRDVGSTPRGIDQRLWREFRKLIDDLFNRRSEQNKADNEARKEHRKALEARVEDLELAAGSDADISDKGLKALSQAIDDACADLSLDRQIVERIKSAEENYAQRIVKQKAVKAEQAFLAYRDWDIAVSEAEQNAQSLEAPHPMFVQRLQGQSNSEDLTRLTIEAEIAADLSSPETVKGERMALQIDLMNRGVRNLDDMPNEEFIARWCGCGPKDAGAAELRERFFHALDKRRKPGGK